jgi:NADPH:quinone reductase-like Zn-dependent oxidoreductase
MRAFEIAKGSTTLDGLRASTRPEPTPRAGQILVRMRAVSINYRDLMIARGMYMGGPAAADTIALSDGAGEVQAVGPGVTRFRVGDHAAGTFFRGWQDGPQPGPLPVALGAAPVDGVLAEQVVFDEQDAVVLPAHLSMEAAATLPCAGLTAWHALVENGRVRPGDTVLVIGTGGVSIFALQFARLAGARVVVISSSDEKLRRARVLGAEGAINYQTTPDWEREVLAFGHGRGADHVIEVGGAGTLARSLACVAPGGCVALIGAVSGFGAEINPFALLAKQASIRGVFVGTRGMFERMNTAIASHKLEPVVDKVFGFDDTPAAYRHLESGAHFGKVVVRL